MEELLILASNCRSLTIKLPYELRERWRIEVSELHEKGNSQGSFCDLVKFIEKLVHILTDPIFSNIIDQTIRNSAKTKSAVKINKTKSSSSRFATPPVYPWKVHNVPNMLTTCLFHAKEHLLDVCHQFKRKMHKDKIQFLKEKGICFGCLVKGHMSKTCTKCQICKVCNQKHPTVLHTGKVDNYWSTSS